MKGLYDFFKDASTIPNSHTNEVAKTDYFSTSKGIITYCGYINGTKISDILIKLYEKDTGYYIMSQTEMGEILNVGGKNGIYYYISQLLKKDDDFDKGNLKTFIRCNILGETPQRFGLDGKRSKYIKDYKGNEIEGLLTVFDYCSEKIIGANASGNALFIGNETNGTDNVFVLTELPTLLNNSKVTMIDGIDTSLFLSERSSGNEEDLVEIFNCLIGVCNKAFSGITGSKEDKANIENLSNKLDEVSKLKEFSEYGLDEKKILGSNGILDSDEAVDLYFTKREGSKLCLAA